MNLLDPVSELMSKKLYTLSEHSTIEDAKDIFDKYRIHHIPVVKGGEFIGIISKSDFLGFLSGYDNQHKISDTDKIKMKAYQVGAILTRKVATIESSTKINVALEIFKENLFHAIPVVDDGELVGLITTLDIIRKLSADNEAHATYNTDGPKQT